MWKIAVAFAVFAGLALFILSKGGDIDMGGEKHGVDVTHVPEVAASAPAASAVTAPAAPVSATASAPKPGASK